MSAFGGKADMAFFGCPLSRSLSGVKRTRLVATHMSANDPKRTSAGLISNPFQCSHLTRYDVRPDSRGCNEAARVHDFARRRGGLVAACRACAEVGPISDRISQP